MTTLMLTAAGALAGLVSNATGYLITGRWFHRFQALTPGTWRARESWAEYSYSMAIRLAACVAIALLFGAVHPLVAVSVAGALSAGAGFGLVLWAVTILPVVVEASLFVNWHRGFVVGLLLDWLVVCLLATLAAALALRAG